MKRFAVIDIGSNSVRLMYVADGKVLYKRLNTTRLGEGLAVEPILRAEPIERTAQAVAAFNRQAMEKGAENVYAFATAAVRTAENRDVFLRRVDELCGLQIEVISGAEEAEIGLLGSIGNKNGGVIDIGGASTELVVKRAGELVYKKSINVGVVRLKDGCGKDENALKSAANAAAAQFKDLPKEKDFYGIGGTATTLAAQYLQLREYDSEKITGTVIPAEDMQLLAKKLSSLSVEEIAALPCMPSGRADVITGGAILLVALMRELNIPHITVSDRDNLEGYAISRRLME